MMNLTELGQSVRDLAAALKAGDWRNVFALTGTIIAETGGVFKDAKCDEDGWPLLETSVTPARAAAAPKGHVELENALAELKAAAVPRLKARALPPAGSAVSGPPGAARLALDPGLLTVVLDLVERVINLWKSWGGGA